MVKSLVARLIGFDLPHLRIRKINEFGSDEQHAQIMNLIIMPFMIEVRNMQGIHLTLAAQLVTAQLIIKGRGGGHLMD